MAAPNAPLAERIRPDKLEDFLGQEHLTGPNGVLRKTLAGGKLPSMIFWGPPGVGKTTMANIIANQLNIPFYTLSAISSGVKDVREAIAKAKFNTQTILFIDEIHRFNKSQQDALLGAVEKGIITLIGATTENPSFEVNSALISRCQVYTLRSLEESHLKELIESAIRRDDKMASLKIELKETAALFKLSGGDARKLLNLFEIVVNASAAATEEGETVVVTDALVTDLAQQRVAIYDKNGEQHYDIISALIKSIRGSDPNATVYYLARMIEGGEDVKFIARRLLISASEDIGNANPTALVIATNAFQAVSMIGYPESRIILSQCAVYLACSPKSNASYMAIINAQSEVKNSGDLSVPLSLRNAPTKFMKDSGYGKDYKYAHSYPGNFVPMDFLPKEIDGKKFYEPGNNPRENDFRKRLKAMWKEKYGY